MTKDEIMQLEEQELNVLMSTKVMGVVEHPLPPYSTEISAAWQVYQHMTGRLFSVRQRFKKDLKRVIDYDSEYKIHPSEVALRLTPEVICRAALLTVSSELSEANNDTE